MGEANCNGWGEQQESGSTVKGRRGMGSEVWYYIQFPYVSSGEQSQTTSISW